MRCDKRHGNPGKREKQPGNSNCILRPLHLLARLLVLTTLKLGSELRRETVFNITGSG
jgi:hypothetical protein